MRIDYILKASAKRMQNSKVTIDWGSDCDDWVSIDAPGEESIFMQGNDATEFQAEIKALEHRCTRMNSYTIALALAEQYVESIWG